jgi:hypothetical protein
MTASSSPGFSRRSFCAIIGTGTPGEVAPIAASWTQRYLRALPDSRALEPGPMACACCGERLRMIALTRPTLAQMSREHELLATFQRLREALLANDVEAPDSLLAEDYCGFDPGGNPQDRSLTIEAYRPGMTRLTRYDVDDVEVRLMCEAGILVGLGSIEGTFGEWPFAHLLRFADVYRATADGWRLSLSSSTPVQDPRDA